MWLFKAHVWRTLLPFGSKIKGIPDFQVHIPYLGGNVCQQREITCAE